MCEISEKWYREGEIKGEIKAKQETTYKLADRKMPLEAISDIVEVSLETVKKWLAERPAATR